MREVCDGLEEEELVRESLGEVGLRHFWIG